MSVWEAVLLGVVQGLTEFLPVSSSGHLALCQQLFGLDGVENFSFALRLHAGTLVAVVIAFRSDLKALVRGAFFGGSERRLFWLLCLAMIPTAAAALVLLPFLEGFMESAAAVGVGLLLTGAVLFGATLRAKRSAPRVEAGAAEAGRSMDRLGVWGALWVGFAQGVAALPGVSRSGMTISAGLFRGLDGESSARFSFLLSVLAISAGMLLEIFGASAAASGGEPVGWGVSFAGMAAALAAGLLSIRWLMRLARLSRFGGFAAYCAAVGALLLLFGV